MSVMNSRRLRRPRQPWDHGPRRRTITQWTLRAMAVAPSAPAWRQRPGSKEPALAVPHISLPPPFHSGHLTEFGNVWTLSPAMKTPLILPWPLQGSLEAVARVLLE